MAIVIIIISGLALDQFSKFLILRNLATNQSIPLISNVFHLTLVFNRGAAFGILKDHTIFFIVASVIAILIFTWKLKKDKKVNLSSISLALILSGAIGNLIDRIRFGFVVDFLDFRIWPVFNIADSMITIGAILFVFLMLKSHYVSRNL